MRKAILTAGITLILVSVFTVSCKKDKFDKLPITETNADKDTCTCVSIPEIPGYSNGYNYLYESEVISTPIFNPNDDNEILYVVRSFSLNEKRLVKYNLVTKEKTILFTGEMFGFPAWSKLNWIVFDNGYNGLYRIRPDGSNFSLFTADGYQFSPAFNEAGDKLLTFHAFANQYQYTCKIWNIDGLLIDSMNYKVNQEPRWKRQNNIAFRSDDKIFILDPETKEIIKTHETFLGSFQIYSHGFAWLNEDYAIVEHGFNIKKLNVQTGELTKLFSSCDSRRYLVSDANGDGSKVIFNKIVSKVQKAGFPQNLLVYFSISIYDLQTDTLIDIEIE